LPRTIRVKGSGRRYGRVKLIDLIWWDAVGNEGGHEVELHPCSSNDRIATMRSRVHLDTLSRLVEIYDPRTLHIVEWSVDIPHIGGHPVSRMPGEVDDLLIRYKDNATTVRNQSETGEMVSMAEISQGPDRLPNPLERTLLAQIDKGSERDHILEGVQKTGTGPTQFGRQ
jgi:hypothetical protein